MYCNFLYNLYVNWINLFIIVFVINLTWISDQLVCEQEANSTVIQEGSFAHLACGMQFTGPIQLWNSVWTRGNITLSSIDEDEGDYIRRTVSFSVYSSNSGSYLCVMSNQHPPYYSQCETSLNVISKFI
jgi:hypothetical protein